MLSLSHVTKRHAGSLVLAEVSLAVPPGSRIGVVGPNGIGKSTLLRIIAGLEEPDSGRVTRTPPSLSVGYLEQEADAKPGESVLAYVARRTGVAAAEAELEQFTDDYAVALERFVALGGTDLHPRTARLAAELGLPRDRLDVPMASLSGGESARARLAAILLSRYHVLLLDEPTNDLDFDGLERLERFVESFDGAVVLVSHDRAFLDRTVTRIAELEEGRHTLREYAGGFSEYERARDAARAAQYRLFGETEERRRDLGISSAFAADRRAPPGG